MHTFISSLIFFARQSSAPLRGKSATIIHIIQATRTCWILRDDRLSSPSNIPEDERECADVVDLIREVRAARSHNDIGSCLHCEVVVDFRNRVGHGKYERRVVHRLQHLGGQHVRHGQAREDIRACNSIFNGIWATARRTRTVYPSIPFTASARVRSGPSCATSCRYRLGSA